MCPYGLEKTSFSRDQVGRVSKIRLGPDESYQGFAARLLKAVGRIAVDGEAGTVAVRQLALENAYSARQAAIPPWEKEPWKTTVVYVLE